MRATAFVVVLSILLLSTAALAGESATQATRTEVFGLTQAKSPVSEGAKTDVPGLINYQGTLTDEYGVALDTTVSMTFSIYTDSTGGNTVWDETQSAVVVTNGIFNALLGSVNPISDTVFSSSSRWLGVQVESDPELQPKQRIVSVGYTFRAAEADTADYARSASAVSDGDWTISGNNIYAAVPGNVGIGTTTPFTKLEVWGELRVGIDTDGTHWDPDSIGQYSFGAGYNTKAIGDVSTAMGDYTEASGAVSTAMGAYTQASGDYSTAMGWNTTARGNWAVAIGSYLSADTTNAFLLGSGISHGLRLINDIPYSLMVGFMTDTPTLFVGGNQRVGIGTANPAKKLDVAGTVQMTGFKMPQGAFDGYVLTSNADGVGSWQPVIAEGDSDWTISGDDIYSAVSGNVGIGITSPTEKLQVGGVIHSTTGGFRFPDGTIQTTAEGTTTVPLILSGSSVDPILQVTNTGTGHGIGVNSTGADGVHVYQAGLASGTTTSTDANGLEVAGAQGNGLYIGQADKRGVYVYNADSDGILVRRAGASTGYLVSSGANNAFEVMATEGYGIYVGNANASGVRVYQAGEPSAGANGPSHNGFEVRGAEGCGLFVGHADSAGVFVNSTGGHGFVVLEPEQSGLYVSAAGGYGVYVDSSNDAGVYVYNAGDDGGYFDLGSGSSGWAVYAHSTASSGNGIYCYGNGVITGSWSKSVQTSKGSEVVQTLSSPDEEIVASGMARLTDGRCRVIFERLFSEAISPQMPVKIVLTSLDQWSGLYATERSHTGFTVLSGAGARDVEFTWQTIGRRKGYEQRPKVTIPDPEEENARLEAEARGLNGQEEPARLERITRRMEPQNLPRQEGGFLIDPAGTTSFSSDSE